MDHLLDDLAALEQLLQPLGQSSRVTDQQSRRSRQFDTTIPAVHERDLRCDTAEDMGWLSTVCPSCGLPSIERMLATNHSFAVTATKTFTPNSYGVLRECAGDYEIRQLNCRVGGDGSVNRAAPPIRRHCGPQLCCLIRLRMSIQSLYERQQEARVLTLRQRNLKQQQAGAR